MNANYIDGYRKQNAYIATQGSLPETFGDFWRMIWEQRSATVVMMTKLEERSRVRMSVFFFKILHSQSLCCVIRSIQQLLFPQGSTLDNQSLKMDVKNSD